MTYNAFIIYGFTSPYWISTDTAAKMALPEWLEAQDPTARTSIEAISAGAPRREHFVGYHLHYLCDFTVGKGSVRIPQHLELPEYTHLRLARLRQKILDIGYTEVHVGPIDYFLVGNAL